MVHSAENFRELDMFYRRIVTVFWNYLKAFTDGVRRDRKTYRTFYLTECLNITSVWRKPNVSVFVEIDDEMYATFPKSRATAVRTKAFNIKDR